LTGPSDFVSRFVNASELFDHISVNTLTS